MYIQHIVQKNINNNKCIQFIILYESGKGKITTNSSNYKSP